MSVVTFYAEATKANRVRLFFSEPMLDTPYLVDPAQYSVIDPEVGPVTITSVDKEQFGNPRSVALNLASDLIFGNLYEVTISTNIITASETFVIDLLDDFTLTILGDYVVVGSTFRSRTTLFQWLGTPGQVSIPLSAFSGEVQGWPYGTPAGLVFFSPSLLVAAPNSSIAVESVSACTRASDEYVFPVEVDPPTLSTYGSSIVPTPEVTTLNFDSLWVAFPRKFQAKLTLGVRNTDTVPTAVSSRGIATVAEPWDKTFISLLNDPAWKVFDNAGTPPLYFITANNLAPIPPGPMTVITLEP